MSRIVVEVGRGLRFNEAECRVELESIIVTRAKHNKIVCGLSNDATHGDIGRHIVCKIDSKEEIVPRAREKLLCKPRILQI